MLKFISNICNIFKPKTKRFVWEPGMKALCIKSHRLVARGAYREGVVYLVKNVIPCCKHAPVLLDIGIYLTTGCTFMASGCPICDIEITSGVGGCDFLANAINFVPYQSTSLELSNSEVSSTGISIEEETILTPQEEPIKQQPAIKEKRRIPQIA